MFPIKTKRPLAMLLAVLMTVSLLPTGILATGPDFSDRVQNYHGGTQYYKADGGKGSAADHSVAIKKTAAATDIENQFDITLQVDVKDKVVTTNIKTGVDIVLVFDASSSMTREITVNGIKTDRKSVV